MTGYIAKTGVVAMLDLLGISNLSSDECINLLQARDNIIQTVKNHQLIKFIPDLEIYQFGDTILFCLEANDEGVAAFDSKRILVFFLNHLVTKWIDEGFLIRGAVAYGEYVLHSDKSGATVIGPAVAEVARWYEAVNWAGVVVVPSCAHLVEHGFKKLILSMSVDDGIGWFPIDYIKFSAPITDDGCKNKNRLWCLAWPVELRFTEDRVFTNFMQERERIVARLEELKKIAPPSAHVKYENTIRFVKYCNKDRADILLELMDATK